MNTSIRQGMLIALACCVLTCTRPVIGQEEPTPSKAAPAIEASAPESSKPESSKEEPAALEVESPDTPAPESSSDDTSSDDDSTIHHTGSAVVHLGSDSYLAAGQTADSVVSVGGSSTSDGTVADAVVAIMGDSRVTGDVGDAVVAIMGNVYVNSKVGGDVVAVFGDVQLGPQAEISGDVVSVGGVITRDAGAKTHGATNEVSIPVHIGHLNWLRPWLQHALLYGRPLAIDPGLGWAWALALGFLAFYTLLAVLFPVGVRKCVSTLEAQPGASFLTALLSLLLTPMLAFVLVVTVIGIAVLPFLWLGLFFVGLFGKTVILAAIGRRVMMGRVDGPHFEMPLAVLIGGGILLVLYLIPIVGNILYVFTGFLGFGVVVYTFLSESRAKRPPPVSGAAAPKPAAPSTGQASAGAASPFAAPVSSANGVRVEPQLADPDFTASNFTDPNSTDPKSSAAGPAEPGLEEPSMSTTTSTSTNSAPPSENTVPLSTAAASLTRASFVLRMGALAIDVLLVAVIVNNLFDHTEMFSMILVPLAIYGASMWKLKGTTIGGIVFNLQVVRLDGREIDWSTAIVRALACFLSLVAAGLGFFWMLFDSERQTWHDKIAGTVVVRVPKGMSLV